MTNKKANQAKSASVAKKSNLSSEIKESSISLDASKVTQGVSELLKMRIEYNESQGKTKLFDTEGEPVLLTIAVIRIVNCPSRIHRFVLPHPLIQETTDVVLIVRDLEPKVRKPDHEAVIELYETRLLKSGIKHPIKILPIRQVMNEYKTFEAKRLLANSYDVFLADAHIVGRLMPILGKVFSEKRLNPIPVKVDDDDLFKKSVSTALCKTSVKITAYSSTLTVQVGHTKQSAEDICENIITVVNELSKVLPGGYINIRNIIVKTARSKAIPLYVSVRTPNEVKIQKVERLKLKHGKSVEGELSTHIDSSVIVHPSGRVKVIGKKPTKAGKGKKIKKVGKMNDEIEDEGIEEGDDDEFSDLEDEDEDDEEIDQKDEESDVPIDEDDDSIADDDLFDINEDFQEEEEIEEKPINKKNTKVAIGKKRKLMEEDEDISEAVKSVAKKSNFNKKGKKTNMYTKPKITEDDDDDNLDESLVSDDEVEKPTKKTPINKKGKNLAKKINVRKFNNKKIKQNKK